MAAATHADWERRQHRLNLFTKQYLKGVGPIREDGEPGPSTTKRIKQAQWWLGWEKRDGHWSDKLGDALRKPRDWKLTSKGTVARGIKRRAHHNLLWAKSHLNGGVTTYDGVRVARWLVPYLDYARRHGWKGHLVSGYRDPVYSEHLCFAMCGRPSCPGRCAGRASNHSGDEKPRGALDVSEYQVFGRLMQGCPERPGIYNALGSQDPVHFSTTGR